MKHEKLCHSVLRIPSSQIATAALSYSQREYRRVLASWASDLLLQRVSGRVIAREATEQYAKAA
jgi:hypothetical protein